MARAGCRSAARRSARTPGRALTLAAQAVPLYHGETGRVVDDLKRWSGDGWRVVLVFEGHGPAAAGGRGAARRRPRRTRGRPRWTTAPRARRDRWSTTGALEHGFVDEAAGWRSSPATTSAAAGARPQGTCARCRAGGATRSTRWSCGPATSWCTSSTASAGTWSWCSAPSTAPTGSTWSSSTRPSKRGQPGDRLFVPTDSLDQLSRYVGGETPTLHKMGGADWKKAKARARKAVREIAAQLIQLYAARQTLAGPRVRPGHAVAAGAGGRLPVHRDARTSWPRSRRSRPTWRSRCRWTG